MPNMGYCRFENTSNDMQDIIDKMYEDDFDPEKLSNTERRYFDALWDQCETMIQRLEEIQDMMDAREVADERKWEDAESRLEEYEMHRAIVGTKKADEDFNNTFSNESIDDDYDSHTFTRKD